MNLGEFFSAIVAPAVIFIVVAGVAVFCCAVLIVSFSSRYSWVQSIRDGINNIADNVTAKSQEISDRISGRGHLYSQLPSSFAGDMEAGLSSSTFDLNENLDGEDGRAGLDEAAKREILKIMKRRRMKFDQARKVYTEQRFAANGIGADGRPRDPKFVSFS